MLHAMTMIVLIDEMQGHWLVLAMADQLGLDSCRATLWGTCTAHQLGKGSTNIVQAQD